MANFAPLSALDAESGVVVQFNPSTNLPSIPGGLRVVGLIGTGVTTKTLANVVVTRGALADTVDYLTPAALSLPSQIMDANYITYNLGVDYSLSLPRSISAASPATAVPGGSLTLNINGDGAQTISLTADAAGVSISGSSPAITDGAGLTFNVNIDGDGAQSITTSGSDTTGAEVASDLQTKIRALTANHPANQASINAVNVVYTTVYTVVSGSIGAGSSVVITGAGAASLKLGVANGGTENTGTGTGTTVAADIQAKVRALSALHPVNQVAYDNFTAAYTTVYTLTSGTTPSGSVVVSNTGNASLLKLGIANGGTETTGGGVSWGPAMAAEYTSALDIGIVAQPTGINLNGLTLQLFFNGSQTAWNTVFAGNNLTPAEIISQINAVISTVATATIYVVSSANYLRITTLAVNDASLQIGNGNANTLLGFVPGVIVDGPAEPNAGVTYTVTYGTPKVSGSADYAPVLFTNLNDITAAYGTVGAKDTVGSYPWDTGAFYSLPLGSNIIFQNSDQTGGIVCVQVDPADGSELAGFQNALNKLALVDGINIVVCMDSDPLLNPSIVSHVVNSSAPLEMKERTAIMGLPLTATVSSAIGQAAAIAAGHNGRRFLLAYPPATSSPLALTSTGAEATLGGEYIAAAIAGLRINANYDVAEPLLRKQLVGIDSASVNLLRTDKLRLRDGGVTVVELLNGTNVTITEDTTTDRTTADNEEFAVTEIVDFTANTIRTLLNNIFIGVKILTETPSIVSATVQVILNDLQALNIITASSGVQASINVSDPRQIDVSFQIQPVRGLRWIYVQFSIGG